MRIKIVFVLIGVTLVHAILDEEFIKDYFREKSIKHANVFTCGSLKGQKSSLKSLMELNIPISLKRIDKNLSYAMFPWEDVHVAVVVDADCPKLDEFLEECNVLKIFDYGHHFLLLASSHAIIERISNLWLNINSDLKLGIAQGTSRILYDVYKTSSKYGASLNVTYYGIYDRKKKFEMRKRRFSLYQERRNMTGIEFKMFTVLPTKYEEPTVADHIRSDNHLGINSFNRINSVFMLYVADYYNFTIKMDSINNWGFIFPNGSFDGLIGSYEQGIADFGGSPIFQWKERYVAVDYGRMTWRLLSAFIFRHPKHKSSFEVFLRPLDAQVWIFVLICGLLIAVIMKCALRFELLSGEETEDGVEDSWSSLMLFLIGALCQQGAGALPSLISGRIITIYVFVFAVLLYQFYSGSIVSFLLMQPARTLKTIPQLVWSDLKIGCENVSYNKVYFRVKNDLLNDPKLIRLKQKPYKRGGDFFLGVEEGLPLIAKGGFAYHVELATAYPIIEKTFSEKAICDLEEIPFFDAKAVHASFPKKSPNRDMANFVLQNAAERGVMHRQIHHFHARKPECIGAETETSPVGLDEFYPALTILAFGMILSMLLLGMEILIEMRNERKRTVIKPFVN